MLMLPGYLNTTLTSGPWILRYLSAAAIPSRKASLSHQACALPCGRLLKVQMKEYPYQDQVTCLLEELYIKFDCEAAQEALKEAVDVIGGDFFLREYKDEVLGDASV